MVNKKLILFSAVYIVIFFPCIFSMPAAALADNNNNTFSFRFENCTVGDALMEISQKSGVNIISNSVIKKEILSKSYINRNLDAIIADLLRGENCAVVWNYNRGSLESIGLYTFDKDDAKRSATASTTVRRPLIDNDEGFLKNRTISETKNIRNTYFKNNEIGSRRSNNNLSTFRTSDKSSSTRVNLLRNSNFGAPLSANKRRIINNQPNNRMDEEGEVKNEDGGAKDVQPPPELPEPEASKPEKYNGLEPPPMPPGIND